MEETPSILWVVVNLFFAVVALGLGFISGVFCCGGKGVRGQDDQLDQDEALGKRIAVERALLASGQLHDLASGAASDLGDHSRCVAEISQDLAQSESDGKVSQAQLASAIHRLLDANDNLQTRLEKAEIQMKAQALEIAAHESEARTDSLTGLANRRAFDDELGRRFAERQRKSTPFSLLILDVDHFKNFNDTYGHPVGDEVLKQVAATIKESIRAMDVPCRYGGEEFAVVLPTTRLDDAVLLSERIRTAIGDRSITHEGEPFSVTVSLGVAEVSDDDAKLILRRADEALYEAKREGRNRTYLNFQGRNLPAARLQSAPGAARQSERKPSPLKLLDKLPNRTIFVNQLSKRVAESQRTRQPLAMVAVQVEGCCRVKQEYGEPVAELALDSVAQFIQKTLREMDSIARVDEERFAVLLPNADRQFAEQVANRLSTALGGCVVPLGDAEWRLDAKFAYTAYHEPDTAAMMLERTEVSLEEATAKTEPLLVDA